MIKKNTSSLFQDFIKPIGTQELRRWKWMRGLLLVGFLATGTFLSLFLYIFHDFVHGPLKTISEQIFLKGQLFFRITVCAAIVLTGFRLIYQKFHGSTSWSRFLQMVGYGELELRVTQRHLRLLLKITGSIFFFLLIYAGFRWNFLEISFGFLLGVLGDFLYSKFESKPPTTAFSEKFPDTHVLYHWRKRAMKAYLKTNRLFLGGGCIFLIGIVISGTFTHEFKLTQLLALANGIYWSLLIPILIAKDLEFAWFERHGGISHEEWTGSWQRLCTRMAGVIFISISLLLVLTQIPSSWSSSLWLDILLSALLGSFPLWMAPSLALQIDGHKVPLNILMFTLLFIFMGTAMMALPWCAVLLFPLHRELHQYQKGRFSREVRR